MGNHFTDAAQSLWVSLRNALRPPQTVEFPEVRRPRAERYRASFALLHDEQGDELCIGCLFCEKICPSSVISIKAAGKRESPFTGKKRGYADDFTLDTSACIFCELCVQVCPTDAIVMTREQEEPAYSREGLVLTMERLYANEKNKTRAWGDGTKLMAMQEVPKAPKAEPAPKVEAAPKAPAPPKPGPDAAAAAPRPSDVRAEGGAPPETPSKATEPDGPTTHEPGPPADGGGA
jgi:NADH-quinone oxidoreductase subunit I